jgi:hypothetical protein
LSLSGQKQVRRLDFIDKHSDLHRIRVIDAFLTFHVFIKGTSDLFLKLRPPHVWWLLACKEQILDDLIGLANINGMYTNTIIVFYKTFECFSSFIWTLQPLNLSFGRIATGYIVHQKGMDLHGVDGI